MEPSATKPLRPISAHVRNIVVDILLTIASCGLYNLYVQHVQMKAVNDMLGQQKYSFLPWFIFTIITCGLYHIYHEYRMTDDIVRIIGQQNGNETVIVLVLSIFGLTFVADAIQQSMINRHYGNDQL